MADRIVESVEAARAVEEPFFHLEFDSVFPDDVYSRILALKPDGSDYRPMHGRSKGSVPADGTHTRVKIELLPEYLRKLSPAKRDLWAMVGRALRSDKVGNAFVRRLAPALSRRFGADHANIAMYPVPVLTRDVPGYMIRPHTDTHWKAITVQFYLPDDDANVDVGTIMHGMLLNGLLKTGTKMRFARNSGYAFVVDGHTWHSADKVHDRIATRDSILLNYLVDQGFFHRLRNRAKRVGSFLGNEILRHV